MKFKYCPDCGSMSFTQQLGKDKCIKCGFVGIMKEGAMNEINDFQKKLKSKASFSEDKPKPVAQSSLKAKLDSLKGKKTDDYEIL